MNSTEESTAGAAAIDLWLAPPRVFSCRKYGYYIPDAFCRSLTRLAACSYQVSKLLQQLFAVREDADSAARRRPFVVVNTVNPGLCYTSMPCPGSFGRFSLSECSHVFLRGRIVLDTSVDEIICCLG